MVSTGSPYVDRLKSLLDTIDQGSVDAVVEAIRGARTVYIAGNGGSDANASHLALHLNECGLRAQNLMAEIPLLTAYANDFAYDEVVRKRLKQTATPEDCLVVLSGSGLSRNIILALVSAMNQGIKTVGILGFGGGDALALCDVAIVLQSREYGPVEDTHSAIIHLIQERIR